MTELTNLEPVDSIIQTSLGPILSADWILDESSRIKAAGGETQIRTLGGHIQLFLVSVGPDFKKENWRNCDDNKVLIKGARFK